MIDVYDTTGRILAWSVGRALPTRATSSIGPDPTPVFGIAPIKVVSDDIIQAVVLAGEARYAGQQVVVVATELLRSHVTTGQQPIKDNHLNALLAWVRPVPGVDPAVEADRRALVPAAAMLERDIDDHVEFLR